MDRFLSPPGTNMSGSGNAGNLETPASPNPESAPTPQQSASSTHEVEAGVDIADPILDDNGVTVSSTSPSSIRYVRFKP